VPYLPPRPEDCLTEGHPPHKQSFPPFCYVRLTCSQRVTVELTKTLARLHL
jgi:hypothetical protein